MGTHSIYTFKLPPFWFLPTSKNQKGTEFICSVVLITILPTSIWQRHFPTLTYLHIRSVITFLLYIALIITLTVQ